MDDADVDAGPAKVDKRRAIVLAGVELIRARGLGGFTQPRVASRVGLRQSLITYYFPTRDDLLAAVAEEAVRQRLLAIETAHAAGKPREVVAALARVLADPEQTRILVALTQAADQHEAVRASFSGLGTAINPLAAGLLTAVGAEATDADKALLQATATGIAVLALARGGPDLPAQAEGLLTTLLDLLAAAGKGKP